MARVGDPHLVHSGVVTSAEPSVMVAGGERTIVTLHAVPQSLQRNDWAAGLIGTVRRTEFERQAGQRMEESKDIGLVGSRHLEAMVWPQPRIGGEREVDGRAGAGAAPFDPQDASQPVNGASDASESRIDCRFVPHTGLGRGFGGGCAEGAGAAVGDGQPDERTLV